MDSNPQNITHYWQNYNTKISDHKLSVSEAEDYHAVERIFGICEESQNLLGIFSR